MQKEFILIDESGSPDFFGRRKRPLWLDKDFQPVLLMGMVVTKKRRKLRKVIKNLQQQILSDELYNTIPSLKKPGWFFHGRTDHPEVRIKFMECIRSLDYVECYVVIARKIPELFISKHNGNPKEFYYDIYRKLIEMFPFQNNTKYQFYLARRQSDFLKPYRDAIEQVTTKIKPDSNRGGNKIESNCEIVYSKDFPELSVIDYLLWAVYRYITKKERRYLTALEDKYTMIYDIYDDEIEENLYNTKNPFILEKAKDFYNIKK